MKVSGTSDELIIDEMSTSDHIDTGASCPRCINCGHRMSYYAKKALDCKMCGWWIERRNHFNFTTVRNTWQDVSSDWLLCGEKHEEMS